MAKFNITVELDWINEEGGIDELVKQEIIENVTSRFSQSINQEIIKSAEKNISNQITSTIDTRVNEIMDNLLNKEFPLLDRYGDVVKKKTTVIELIKEKLDSFLSEKVDNEGRASQYNSNITRLDYIINKNITYTMEQKVKNAADQIRKNMESYIDTTLKQQIGENVAKIIGLDKIINKK